MNSKNNAYVIRIEELRAANAALLKRLVTVKREVRRLHGLLGVVAATAAEGADLCLFGISRKEEHGQ